MEKIPILILAAGGSTRMHGRDKLMESVGGQLQIRRLTLFCAVAGLAPHVALPGPGHPRTQAIAGLNATRLYLPGSAEGMGGTLRDGVAALPPCARFLITAADLPGLTIADLRAIATTDPGDALIVIATSADGALGHPIAFDAALRPAFAALAGDIGAKSIVQAHPAQIRTIALPGHHATRDLDTPEEWAAWRAETGL